MDKSLFLLLTILQRSATDFYHDTNPRLNWGVIFRRGPHVLNGFSKYRHTFSIPIPIFNFNKLDPVICSHNEIIEIHCRSINDMINAYNLETEPKVHQFNTQLKALVASIPNIDYDKRRRKRDYNLGADFCDRIKDPNYTTEQTTSGLGRFLSGFLGRPTYDDIRVLDRHICLVTDQIELEAEEIKRTANTLESFSLAIDDRINAIEKGQTLLYNDLQNTNRQVANLSKSIGSAVNYLERQLHLAIASSALILKVEEAMQKNRDILSEMSVALERFQSSINILMSGRLPSSLVSYETLDELLIYVNQKLIEYNMKIVNKNPMFYYLTDNIVFTHSEKLKRLFVLLNIPVYALGGLLYVYRIDVYNLPVNEKLKGGSKIVELPDFIAVTQDGNYYLEMSSADLSTCTGLSILTCTSEKSLQSFAHLTCAAALFKEAVVDIERLCDFRYDPDPQTSFATKITNNTYLVHAKKFGPEYIWTVDCSYSGNDKHQAIESCQHCIINLPCGCSLTAVSEFLIPAQFNDCPFSQVLLGSDVTPVEISYPINLATARILFENDELERIKRIGANDLSPEWEFQMPDLQVLEYNWTNTVEESHKYSMKLRQLVQASKESTRIFVSKSDSILAEVTNFSDLALSQISELQDSFKPWEFLADLDPDTSGVVLLVFYILNGTSLVLSCYVLCRKH